jgi:hypothetical protein
MWPKLFSVAEELAKLHCTAPEPTLATLVLPMAEPYEVSALPEDPHPPRATSITPPASHARAVVLDQDQGHLGDYLQVCSTFYPAYPASA